MATVDDRQRPVMQRTLAALHDAIDVDLPTVLGWLELARIELSDANRCCRGYFYTETFR